MSPLAEEESAEGGKDMPIIPAGKSYVRRRFLLAVARGSIPGHESWPQRAEEGWGEVDILCKDQIFTSEKYTH